VLYKDGGLLASAAAGGKQAACGLFIPPWNLRCGATTQIFPSTEGCPRQRTGWSDGENALRFTPQTWRSRAIARETLLEKLRFRYFSAGFRARKGFSPANAP
jgi:hypothetical protein